MSPGSVAVIDIGSNSIKVLVATRSADGNVIPLKIRTLDARISAGISKSTPHLSEPGMHRGVEAIQTLLREATEFNPAQTILVATSAVRDASNGGEFCARVQAATGHVIRILSGEVEANLIGRGLLVDPALRDLADFYVFDLGGGSLECLTYCGRKIIQAVSLQLGCVRLTEKFIADPAQPVSIAAAQQAAGYTRDVLAQSAFKFTLPENSVAVGTGGSVTTVRAILGAREGKPFESSDAVVTVAQLRELLAWLGALPLEVRKQVPGLPPARADVFPTALATLIAVAEAGNLSAFQNSVYNLRYGLAAEALRLD